jgi:LysR family transcriptional regulator, nitrogen assimilation regulatory protein
VVALACSTRLAAPSPVPLYALGGLKLVLPSRRHGLRIVVEDVLRAHSVQLQPRLEVDDMTVIEDFVRRTDWVTILPSSLVQRGLQEGALRVHPIAAPGISRRMLYVRDRRRPMSTAESTFIDVLSRKLAALQNATASYAGGAAADH